MPKDASADRRAPIGPALAVLIVVMIGAGCTTGREGSTGPAGTGAGAGIRATGAATTAGSGQAGIRTDHEPIARRFPGLGDFDSVRWLAGTQGSAGGREIPGPTDYWIEATVRMDAEEFTRLADRYTWSPVGPPAPRPPLQGSLPAPETWVDDATFTADLLSPSGMHGEVLVHPATRTVHLNATTT